MTASISIGVIGTLSCFFDLDLILVGSIYQENCPFLLDFPILWNIVFLSMTIRLFCVKLTQLELSQRKELQLRKCLHEIQL